MITQIKFFAITYALFSILTAVIILLRWLGGSSTEITELHVLQSIFLVLMFSVPLAVGDNAINGK